MSEFVIGSGNAVRHLQREFYLGTVDERFIRQHKYFSCNSDFLADEFRRTSLDVDEICHLLQPPVQVFNYEMLNLKEVRQIRDKMFLQKDEAVITSKISKKKDHQFPSRSFIFARDAFRSDRDKQRRETHNNVEKKRRSFINAKIAELGNMLPDHIDRRTCNRKGTILKETVEYMKKLQRDQKLLEQLEIKIKHLDIETGRMAARLETLEEQPAIYLTNKRFGGMEGVPIQRKASVTDHQAESPNQTFQRQTDQTDYIKTTSGMMPSRTEKINTDWNGLSAVIQDEDTIYDESLPSFADTLSNFF